LNRNRSEKGSNRGVLGKNKTPRGKKNKTKPPKKKKKEGGGDFHPKRGGQYGSFM